MMRERDANGKPKPFSLKWVTFDHKRKTGGEILEVDGHVVSKLEHDTRENGTIGINNPTNSHHIIAVHTWLILKINGLTVLL